MEVEGLLALDACEEARRSLVKTLLRDRLDQVPLWLENLMIHRVRLMVIRLLKVFSSCKRDTLAQILERLTLFTVIIYHL